MVRAKPAQRAEGVRVKGLFLMKKEPALMAYRYIRFVGVVMETGLVVYRPRWHDVMSRKLVPDLTDYQWYKGYADVIGKLVTKCWQEEAYAEAQLRKVTR